jgi:hypothetical protein
MSNQVIYPVIDVGVENTIYSILARITEPACVLDINKNNNNIICSCW